MRTSRQVEKNRMGNAVSLQQRHSLSIGGVTLGISVPGNQGLCLSPDHQKFSIDLCSCDIEIELEKVVHLPAVVGHKLFDSGAVWTLQACGSDYVFDFSSPIAGAEPYKRLIVNSDFSSACLLVRSFGESEIDPLEYPTDELLVMHWLAQGRGVEVHGCGLIDSVAGGQLLIGHSGAGKSTTTRLWTSTRNVEVLSDDRIILRRNPDGLRMYGTPWHGECGLASARSADISRIFVIEHGSENKITRLSPSQAVAEIFVRSFVPFHDREGLDRTLRYLQELASVVACYRFQFVPDAGAVESILNFHD